MATPKRHKRRHYGLREWMPEMYQRTMEIQQTHHRRGHSASSKMAPRRRMHCGLEFARSEGVISFIENSKKQYKTCVILRFWLSVIDPPPSPARTQMTKFLAKHPASAWATQHLAELEPTACAELGTVRAAGTCPRTFSVAYFNCWPQS